MIFIISPGIFDVISCVNYFQHSKYKFFEHKAPLIVLAAQAIFIISPVALLISAQISYAIFNDCRNQAEEYMALNPGFSPNNEWYGGNSRMPPPTQSQGVGGANQRQSFSAFQGRG